MVRQTRRASCMLSLLIILCFACSALAAKASRIELKNGQVYEDVNFSVDDVYEVLTIRKGEWKLSLSLPQVGRIIDDNGQDVTREYVGEYYKPPEPIQKRDWMAEEQMERKGHRTGPFSFGIRVGSNCSFPTGDWYEGIKPGIGYGIDAIIPVTKNMAIRWTISRSGMRHDLKSMADPNFVVLDDNLSLNVWRYAVSGQYYNWPKWRAGGKAMYYLYAGLGLVTHGFSGTMTVKNTISGETGIIYPTGRSQDKFMLTYGGGLVGMLSQRLGFEMGLTADMVFTRITASHSRYEEKLIAFIFGIKAGLVAIF